MLNLLKKPKHPTNSRIIPPRRVNASLGGYAQDYTYLLNSLIGYNKNVIDEVISSAGGSISFPMQTGMLEEYLTGYKINYIGFDNTEATAPSVEGFWEWDKEQEGVANVFYNTNACPERQRFTQVHETFHIYQSLDGKFKQFFDTLLTNSELPIEVIQKLLERATDKATAMYLMPNQHFHKKFAETQDVQELSTYFRVSPESLKYRIQELGLVSNV